MELDEEPDNIKMTLAYLKMFGWIESIDEYEYMLTEVPELIGSESNSAVRVRSYRQRKKILETSENQAIGIEDKNEKALHCNADVTPCNKNVTTEIDIEIEKDIEKDSYLHAPGNSEKAYGIYNNIHLKTAEYESLKRCYPDCYNIVIDEHSNHNMKSNVVYENYYVLGIWAKNQAKRMREVGREDKSKNSLNTFYEYNEEDYC